jgi:hypothetical protein
VDSDIAGIITRLDEQAAAISDALCTAAQDDIPELPRDDGLSQLMRVAMRDHFRTVFRALLQDIDVAKITAPATHIEYARALARRDVPLTAMMRGHRLGQRRLSQVMFAELEASGMESATKAAVIETLARTMAKYVDVVSMQVLAAYQREHELLLKAQRITRGTQIREVLDDARSFDVEAVSTAIAYPLNWQHLALIVWYPGGEIGHDQLASLGEFVRALAAAAETAASPLLASTDPAASWVWLPYRSVPGDTVMKIHELVRSRTDAPNIAIGAMGCGVEGFRRSHRQAQRAREAAHARTGQSHVVVAATDAEVFAAALLDVDVEEIRGWVADVLGPLASGTDDDARLRQILRLFLYFGRPYKVAEELNMALRAVKYHLERAVARRGRPIDDKRNVELALLACQRYGAAVLGPGED